LYTSELGGSIVSASVPSAPRQPDTVPSSLTNRKGSPLNAPAAALGLNAMPVGLPALGIITTSGLMVT
jgi:hypothetical protein